MGAPREKNPAAVALGKRRRELMTPEECAELARVAAVGAKRAHAKRTPEEKRRLARRAAMARYNGPAAAKPTTQNSATFEAAEAVADAGGMPLEEISEFPELKEAVDQLDDSVIAELYAALAARFGS